MTKSFTGYFSKAKGRSSENCLKRDASVEGLSFIEVPSTGYRLPSGDISKTPQVFDFILFVDSHPYFIDIKTTDKTSVPYSTFSTTMKKKTSTQQQFERFKTSYEAGYKNCGFLYHIDLRWYFLSIEKLLTKFKPRMSLNFQRRHRTY